MDYISSYKMSELVLTTTKLLRHYIEVNTNLSGLFAIENLCFCKPLIYIGFIFGLITTHGRNEYFYF